MNKQKILQTIEDLIVFQKQKLYALALNYQEVLTEDDLMQPNDYPLLDKNPYFRYEEGVLMGMYTLQTALIAFFQETV